MALLESPASLLRRPGLLLGLVLLITGAFALDVPVARSIETHRPLGLMSAETPVGTDARWLPSGPTPPPEGAARFGHTVFKRYIWWLGRWPAALAVAIAAALWHRDRLRAAGAVVLASLTVGLIEVLLKWTVGRTRPFKGVAPFDFDFFRGGPAGLFHQSNLSLPSGHALLSGALAMSVAILWPRWRWAGALLAALVGAERILENDHYLSDVVIGLTLGASAAWLAARFVASRGRLLGTSPLAPYHSEARSGPADVASTQPPRGPGQIL